MIHLPDMKLLCGPVALLEAESCAPGSRESEHCIAKRAAAPPRLRDFLIEQLGADVSVLDQEDTTTDDRTTTVLPRKHWLSVSLWKEKTPAQVAAKLKHKVGCGLPRATPAADIWRFFAQEVFWAVIKHGSIVTDQDVLPREAWEGLCKPRCKSWRSPFETRPSDGFRLESSLLRREGLPMALAWPACPAFGQVKSSGSLEASQGPKVGLCGFGLSCAMPGRGQ